MLVIAHLLLFKPFRFSLKSLLFLTNTAKQHWNIRSVCMSWRKRPKSTVDYACISKSITEMFALIFYYFTHIDTGFLQLKIQPAACSLNRAVCCVHMPWTPVSAERGQTSAEALTHPTHTQARTRCTRWLLTALCNSRHQRSPSLEPPSLIYLRPMRHGVIVNVHIHSDSQCPTFLNLWKISQTKLHTVSTPSSWTTVHFSDLTARDQATQHFSTFPNENTIQNHKQV